MTWAKINNLLLVLIITINLYVIAAPLLPQLSFWWRDRGGSRAQALTQQIHEPAKSSKNTRIAQRGNSVVIPAMLLDQPIYNGLDTYAELNRGIWHRKGTSTPDKGGNTVLLGHRFTYTNPRGVFYFLNKLKVGDEVGVTWSAKNYVYKISDVKVVPATEKSIESPTKEARLTLYTCAPLWLPKDRLVVIAKLETKP